MTIRRAVYPGSFDPPTLGHIDLVERGLLLVDELVVAVLRNREKAALFTAEERVEMLEECFSTHQNVRVESFDGLLVDFARRCNCNAVLRGLRAVSDFEYEFQMALMNRRLAPDIETLFLMPSEDQVFVSSRIVREVAHFGGDLTSLVPDRILQRLKKKFPAR